jgi:hypothetical protein
MTHPTSIDELGSTVLLNGVSGLFAVDRMDTWVVRVSFAIPLVCLAALVLWHLISYLAGKLSTKPRTYRQSPEPPQPSRLPADDPEHLEQACAALEDSLAERYMALGESWLRKGQPQKAAATFSKVLRVCPEGRQAPLAQERLREIGNGGRSH